MVSTDNDDTERNMTTTPRLSPDSIVGPAYGTQPRRISARKAARIAKLRAFEAAKRAEFPEPR